MITAINSYETDEAPSIRPGEVDKNMEMDMESNALTRSVEERVAVESAAGHAYHEPHESGISRMSMLITDTDGHNSIVSVAETSSDYAHQTNTPQLTISKQAEHYDTANGTLIAAEQFVLGADSHWRKFVHINDAAGNHEPIEQPLAAYELTQLHHGIENPSKVYNAQKNEFVAPSSSEDFDLAA